MIRYVQGNVFSTDCDIVAHGVNCRGAFGSGIAGIIAKSYPRVREAYLDKYDSDGWKLGDVQPVYDLYIDKYIVNCATQDNYGYTGEMNADYDAIRTCMEKVKRFAMIKGYSIAIPKIGAGLAGGDWNIIEGILNDVFTDYDVTIYYL